MEVVVNHLQPGPDGHAAVYTKHLKGIGMEHPREVTVLVVGGGGRCHAIVDALARSPQVGKIYCAPGNAGIAAQAECVPLKDTQVEQLRDFALEKGVDLTVVGPEVALAAGITDVFTAAGLRIFGPTKAAAVIESSKDFAKHLMAKYNVPTAAYRTFEDYFGPIYYSFNRGKAHYIVLDNCFYVNRDYQYIGYIDERTFAWLEQDLRFVAKGSPVFVVVHIPTSLTPKLQWNALLQDETSNASGLYRMLEGYDAHIISGHTHFNLNVCFNDSLMEHNTAAVCGIWWKADICMDGTPAGYGVYEVDGTDVKWYYKSAGQSKDYQFRAYPVGASREYPKDIIANVWNWDEKWKVEWYEDGKRMGEMTRFTGYDPDAEAICSDKERVQYDWISPVQTSHLFRATPRSKTSKVEIKVTDRFGNVFSQLLK